jgi:hypothetical protein
MRLEILAETMESLVGLLRVLTMKEILSCLPLPQFLLVHCGANWTRDQNEEGS